MISLARATAGPSVLFMKYRLLIVALALFSPARAVEQPNVVLLFADDQRADTIAALGNPVIKTPSLDRMVRKGLTFKQAYMQGGMHGATCVPSRAMLLSARSLFHIDEKLLEHPTWPAAFCNAGYKTFVSGKWHNGPKSVSKSFQQARKVFTGGMTNPMNAMLSDWKNGRMQPAKLAPKHACEVFADEAIQFIQQQKDQPFFCYVPFDAPHDPHIVPDDFPINYDPATMPIPENFLPMHPFNNGEMRVRDEELLPWPRKPNEIARMTAEYYRYISHLDSQVGRILDAVEKSPHAENTYIIYLADSGVARGSHGLIGKQNLYEHSLRVPLIITGPGIPKDKRSDAFIYTYDLLPTLGKLCQVKAPETSQGKDFTSLITEGKTAGRDELFFAYRDLQRSIRSGSYKLIRYPKIDKTQLFDLSTDPNEMKDLSAEPKQQQRVTAMIKQLQAAMDSEGDKAALTVSQPLPAAWSPPVHK